MNSRRLRLSFDDVSENGGEVTRSTISKGDDHPVLVFRRLAEQAIREADRALVAIHGDPDEAQQ